MLLRARLLALPAAVAAAVLLLSGCTAESPDATGTPVDGGTLTYASGDAEPTCLDPHVGGNYPQALLATQVLESLVSRDAGGAITPWLAESWTVSDDALSYDFTLREGVRFTDGTALDAEAVATTITHLQDPATKSSTGYLAVAKVASVTAVSPTVARFTLTEPDSALLESLAQPWTAIESPTGIARGEQANCEAPVGTGPFTVSEWVKQDHVTLTRNDAYDASTGPTGDGHKGPAHLASITWRFIPDSATRYAAVQSGEADVLDNAQPDTLTAATGASGLVELDAPRPGSVNRLELNSGQAPFDDESVREAFVRGVGVNEAIDSLFFGTAERSFSPLSSREATAYSDPSLFADAGSDSEVSAAEGLLEKAGWVDSDGDGIREKDGTPLTLRFPVSTNQSIPAEQSLFEQIQASAKTLGFDVQISLLDLSSWYAALGANEYELVSAPYTKVGPDVLRILYSSSGITPAPSGYFANHAQIADPALDSLLAQASATTDEAARADLYQQAQRIVLEGYWILPLYDQQNHYLHRSAVQGLVALDTVSTPWFADAWV
ncbi:peptide ABC transporter substrate-binding protein [Rathayibacter rathayi]|uniref:Peptide ABC transporter substrate-binding protein n=1 Tax=Rathayibacter rathayi TaxID=33887 RepID=A0ABD6W6Y5_RATRA|nr:ABC transporter substrate-binding protein [Rathayibacter rathayi]AZZ49752.1 peptide ABC transporter substrate-binding protein [Rathayibacter rathayi]MWV75429.1 ABC transporter substrate-binding protein [Rathayibacter rathayi NCPPB 2980 = VKM Ac-1601]PPF12212.1 peptide ABC transporter substrate-binding protein [Rathayibacter rathayi]PPF22229.1 peptide ABC transporter substrate-binding protein [Rathayibacter rathayi]PPF46619.1 peptide ABC transporter substrate-binding protein [Rathayibacter r